MQLFGIAVLVIAILLVIAALFGEVGTFPVALIALVAAAALVFLWRGTDVRRPPDTRARSIDQRGNSRENARRAGRG